MKSISSFLLLVLLSFSAFSQNMDPSWESIKAEHPYPQWFSDSKLGIFIHWGLYSVPSYCSKEGYGEWYYRGLMLQDSGRLAFQKKNYGENFTYKDFEPLFKAELFNPDEWADLFQQSGAKYVILVTKHHDGYCLWNSKYAPQWNSVNGGPHRDIVGDLTDAVRDKGLKMGFYYSLSEWTNPLHRWTVDPNDSIAEYVDKHMIPQFKELITTYKPTLVFTDGEWDNTAEQWHARELISWYYNIVGKDAIVNDRWGHGADYGFRTPEYSSGITLTDRPWAECRGLGRSFGLNRNEPLSNYMTSDELIRHFVKLVAAGGGMTLNVGPAADGQIPLLQQERLLDLGKWLSINGEAIYGTRPYSTFFEMKDVSLERTDLKINFDWVRNSPDKSISYDNFTAKWSGYIKVDKSDNYSFEIDVDDAALVEIDEKVIVEVGHLSTQNHSTSTQSNAMESNLSNVKNGTIYLEEDVYYPINIWYTEINTNARIKLFWSSTSFEKCIVDEMVFFTQDGGSEHGLKAVYECQQPTVCYTVKGDSLYAIALDFPQDELILNSIIKPEKTTKVMMFGCDKEFDWKYKGGKMIIDTSILKYNDLKSTAAWVFKIY